MSDSYEGVDHGEEMRNLRRRLDAINRSAIGDLRAAIRYAIGAGFESDEERIAWLRLWWAGHEIWHEDEEETP